VCPKHDDEKIFKKKKLFKHHMLHNHDIPEENDEQLNARCHRKVSFKKTALCPFCTKFEPPHDDEEHDNFTSKALFNHVVMHMKEFAVLVLQQVPPPHIIDKSEVSSNFAVNTQSDQFLRLKALASKEPVQSSILKPLKNKTKSHSVVNIKTENQPGPASILIEEANMPATRSQPPLREE
jgi:hypothetical protein